MKAKWSTMAKCIRNMINSALVRGDFDAVERYRKMLNNELKNGEQQ